MIHPSASDREAPSTALVGPQKTPRDPLVALAQLFTEDGPLVPLIRRGGQVSEIATSHVRVTGLSAIAKLGGFVEVSSGTERTLGEVIGIHQNYTTVKLFSAAPQLFLGSPVSVVGCALHQRLHGLDASSTRLDNRSTV